MPGLSLGALGGVRGFATAPASAPPMEQAFGQGASGPSQSNRPGSAPDAFHIALGVWALGGLILLWVWWSAPA
jgi:hypothetical protein